MTPKQHWSKFGSAGLCITIATTKLNANVCNKSFTSFAHVFPPIFIYIFSTSYNKLLASYDQEALTTLTSIQHTSFYNVWQVDCVLIRQVQQHLMLCFQHPANVYNTPDSFTIAITPYISDSKVILAAQFYQIVETFIGSLPNLYV